MQNLEWYLADLKSTGKNTIETVEKSLTDMFIRLVRIYPCLYRPTPVKHYDYIESATVRKQTHNQDTVVLISFYLFCCSLVRCRPMVTQQTLL